MTPPDATLKERGYCWPAEWERHRATWLVWPHNPHTWPGRFAEARHQFARFVASVAKFEPVELLAVAEAEADAQRRLPDLANCQLHAIATNDSWIRDFGPIFLDGPPQATPVLLNCQYNAWGNKYPPFDLDNAVPSQIAQLRGRECHDVPLVLEGGSVDGNGAGILLTTESCLLNPNRNPGTRREQLEAQLRDWLGVDHVIWLTGEIPGDDTDGHIDQIGRFLDTQTVLLVDLPGTKMFRENRQRLERWCRDHQLTLEIMRIENPQPRQVGDMWLPASYANFCFVNGGLLVPTFADRADEAALRVFEQSFPDRQIVDVPAQDLIYGLGALHCLSQQEPDWPLDPP